MSDELEVLAARAAWQSQSSPSSPLALEVVRAASNRFERRLRWRNARELVGAALVAAIFSAYIFLPRGPSAFAWLARIGAGLTVLGAGYVAWYLKRNGWVGRRDPSPAELPTLAYLARYREELLRQSGLLASVVRWYLPPLLVGPLLFVTGRIWARPPSANSWHGLDARFHPWGAAVLILLVVAFVVGWLNHRAAQVLRLRAEALPTPELETWASH